MNREMRRMAEREERLQKKQQKAAGKGASRAQAAASAAQRRQTTERRSFFKRIAQFIHEVRVEMRKVSWPTRDQMVAFTAVTLITSVGLTLIIFGLDAGLKEIVLFVIGGVGG